ncbi:MAG: glycosyltransferase family 39 protein, partial [Candidatus Omnitrophica bacterium]|nr:glycosyltransferase family 39 protein [Candidatus Omnitrophota bacterium]
MEDRELHTETVSREETDSTWTANSSWEGPLSALSRPWVAALFAALVLTVFRLSFVFYPPGPYSDVWDYSQLARNLAEGEGYVSNFTYPLALHYETEPPFPTLWRVPLFSSLIAFVFWLTGSPSLWVPSALAGLAFVFAAALTAGLGCRILSRPLAGVAVLMVVLLPHLLSSALWGLTENVYVCFVLIAVWAMFRNTRGFDLAAGAFLGLSWLTRSNTIFLIPGILVWTLISEVTWRGGIVRATRIFSALCAVCAPWWIRNAMTVGNPFVNVASYLPYTFTETWPAWTLLRTVVPTEAPLPESPVMELIQRGLGNLWTFGFIQRFLSANPAAIGLYYVGLYQAFRNRGKQPKVWAFAAFVGVSETLLVLALCFINPEIRIYSTVLPLVYLVALLPLVCSFQNRNWTRTTVVAVLLLL